jgi:hypothetical protein
MHYTSNNKWQIKLNILFLVFQKGARNKVGAIALSFPVVL